jgi:hypothetical protein
MSAGFTERVGVARCSDDLRPRASRSSFKAKITEYQIALCQVQRFDNSLSISSSVTAISFQITV